MLLLSENGADIISHSSEIPKRGCSKCGRTQKHVNERKRTQTSRAKGCKCNSAKERRGVQKGRKKSASALNFETTRFETTRSGNSQFLELNQIHRKASVYALTLNNPYCMQ